MRSFGTGLIACLALSGLATAQQAVATAAVNVRSGQSTSSRIINHLSAGDTVSLLSAAKKGGYYHVEERDTTKGWVYARYLRVLAGSAAAPAPAPGPAPGGATTHVGASAPGAPGSAALNGCRDHLWQHGYHPQRLLLKKEGGPVPGPILD